MANRDSPIMLKGALVGGPDQADVFPNERNDYKRSEVGGRLGVWAWEESAWCGVWGGGSRAGAGTAQADALAGRP